MPLTTEQRLRWEMLNRKPGAEQVLADWYEDQGQLDRAAHYRTPLNVFVEAWSVCTRCDLHRRRQRVVLGRGNIPCDVLLVGEAPGHSEDTVGLPFCGPAGLLLDGIVARAVPQGTRCPVCDLRCFVCDGGVSCPSGHGGVVDREDFRPALRVAFTNVICCIPLEDGTKTAEPPAESIKACQPRLAEFLLLARPRLIVCVGSVARDWLDQKHRGGLKLPPELGLVRMIDILHPAAVLRMPVAQRDMAVQRCVVQIANAVEDL